MTQIDHSDVAQAEARLTDAEYTYNRSLMSAKAAQEATADASDAEAARLRAQAAARGAHEAHLEVQYRTDELRRLNSLLEQQG